MLKIIGFIRVVGLRGRSNMGSGAMFTSFALMFFGTPFLFGLSPQKGNTRNKNIFQILGLMLSLALLLNGCATMQLPEYRVQKIAHYPYSQVKDGLAVAIYPLIDKEECQEYFGSDLLAENILPVLVVAENQSASSSFILSKDRVSMRTMESAISSISDFNKSSLESSANAIVVAGYVVMPFGVLPGLLIASMGMKMFSDATVIQHNLAVKALWTQTLSPGEMTSGFCYFRLPEKDTTSDYWKVYLEVLNPKDKDMKSFEFTFKWRKQ